jgi:hypothetical protein
MFFGGIMKSYKTCTCGFVWVSRDVFLSDPYVKLVGYQVNFEDLKAGYFMFNHLAGSCKTTLSLSAGDFFDLYDGPVFRMRSADKPECGKHCFHHGDLKSCPVQCECSFVRDILGVVNQWTKQAAGESCINDEKSP